MAATRKPTTAQPIPQDGKCIRYDRETGDYACYLDGRLIGYAANYSAGETLCNDTAYAQLTHSSAPVPVAPEPEAAPVAADALWTPDAVITVESHYLDTENEVTPTPTDRLAFVDYRATTEHGTITLSCPVEADEAPTVFLFEHASIPLDQLLDAFGMLQQLLVDPRVQRRLAGEYADAFPPIPTVPARTGRGCWAAALGSIDGCAVTGTYEGRTLLHAALCFQGMHVTVSDHYLHLDLGDDLDCAGVMHLDTWRTIECLVSHQIVDRLRRHVAHYRTAQRGWACAGRSQRRTPDAQPPQRRAFRARALQPCYERQAA